MRTPLTVIKEFVSIILDGLAGEVTKEQREYLSITMAKSVFIADHDAMLVRVLTACCRQWHPVGSRVVFGQSVPSIRNGTGSVSVAQVPPCRGEWSSRVPPSDWAIP